MKKFSSLFKPTLTILVPVLVNAQLPNGWTSLGCYSDSTSSRTLSAQSYSSSGMTPQACAQWCNALNFKYAGVEYSQECYCDNVIHSPGAPVASGCTMACSGDSAQICGGPNRINIYSTSATATPPSIKQTVGTWVYKGCRIDFSPRSLSVRLNIPSGSNSAEYCTSQCKAQGYALAGLEYGSECWCDSYMPFGQLTDDSQCNTVCPGDNTEFCGAGSRLALYQDTAATPPSPNNCIGAPRDGFSFGNSGIQVIPKQGTTAPGIQMFATTLDPSTDGSVQHTVLTNCKTCGYSSNEAPLYNYQLYNSILSPYGLFGNPIPITPVVGDPLTFLGFSTAPVFSQFCAKPNPVSPEGPFIGFPLLSAGGHTDLWSICPDKTANGRLTVIYSPVDNHPKYNLADCQDIYLQLTPYYARNGV